MLAPTRFTRLVGCRLPLQQAAMTGVATPALARAVADEGGLGMVAAAGLSAERVEADLDEAAAGGGQVGVSFLAPFLDLAVLDAAAAAAGLVECFYGEPTAAIVERIHAGEALAAWQVGSVEEARRAVDAGCDVVIAQGVEAGGHVRGSVGLMALLDGVRRAVDGPVVAAGGIGTGRARAAALEAGADAVRVGTRFLATDEADVHPDYAAALIAAGPSDTTLTDAFSMGWPDAPHRVLRSCVAASSVEPSQRSPFPPTRRFPGPVAEAALYAGESVAGVGGVEPAAAVVGALVEEAAAVLAGGAG